MNRILEEPPSLFLSTLVGMWERGPAARHRLVAELLGVPPLDAEATGRLEGLRLLLAAWNPGKVQIMRDRVIFDVLQMVVVSTPATKTALLGMAIENGDWLDTSTSLTEALVLALALAYRVHADSYDSSIWGIANPKNPA